MTAPEQDDDLKATVQQKAERLTKARQESTSIWGALTRVAGLGWVFILPLVLGAAGGRLLARWLGVPSLALLGLGFGLGVGAYGVFRQLKSGLDEDAKKRGGGATP